MKYILLLGLLFLALKAENNVDYSNIEIKKELNTELPKENNYYQNNSNVYEEVKNKIDNAPKVKKGIITYKNNSKPTNEAIDPSKEEDINIKSNFDINNETKSIDKIEVELGKKF